MKKYFTNILVLIAFTSFTQAAAQQAPAVHLNHIAVYVKDLESTTNFYKTVVGLEMIPEPFHDGKHSWFKVAEHAHLHLIQGADSIVNHNKNGHLCFSVADINKFVVILDKNKVAYEDWPGGSQKMTTRVDGVHQIYFKDPEGNWIEINDDKY
ncbi:MAG: VOC family protein [Ginsengibacter sp.]